MSIELFRPHEGNLSHRFFAAKSHRKPAPESIDIRINSFTLSVERRISFDPRHRSNSENSARRMIRQVEPGRERHLVIRLLSDLGDGILWHQDFKLFTRGTQCLPFSDGEGDISLRARVNGQRGVY